MLKINILFVIMQMEMGGAERLVCDLLKGIDTNMFNPSVAWFLGKDEPLPEIKQLKIPCFYIAKRRRLDLNTMKRMERIIRTNKIDIVNAHHFMSFIYSIYGCKLRNRVKLVYTEHSEWEVNRIGRKWVLFSKYIMSKADNIICVNEKMVSAMRNKFNLGFHKVDSINNGVQEFCELDEDSKRHIRKELGLEDNFRTIGMVANFRKVKNHEFMIDAFANLLNKYQDVRLLLIGQGFKNDPENTESEIKVLVNKKNMKKSVLFLGFRDDVHRILSIVDIFCLVSHKEGTPISLIEAMGAGIPVVGTDVEGIRDIITHKNNGFLVDPGQPQDLTDCLYNLLMDDELRFNLGLRGRQFALENYSLKNCISQYERLFKKLKGISQKS